MVILPIPLAAGLPWAFSLFCLLFIRTVPVPGWVQEFVVLCLFVYLNRLTQRSLQSELAGTESTKPKFPLGFAFGDSETVNLQFRP